MSRSFLRALVMKEILYHRRYPIGPLRKSYHQRQYRRLDKIPGGRHLTLKSLARFHPSGRKTRPFEKRSLRLERPSIRTSAQTANGPEKSDTSSLGALTKIYWGLERTAIVEKKGSKKEKKTWGHDRHPVRESFWLCLLLTFPRVAWKTPNKTGLAMFVPEGKSYYRADYTELKPSLRFRSLTSALIKVIRAI